jgi:hypothetical protein
MLLAEKEEIVTNQVRLAHRLGRGLTHQRKAVLTIFLLPSVESSSSAKLT